MFQANSHWHVYCGSVLSKTAWPYPGMIFLALSVSQVNSVIVSLVGFLALFLAMDFQILNPFEYILIGQSVQWSREGIQSGRVTE